MSTGKYKWFGVMAGLVAMAGIVSTAGASSEATVQQNTHRVTKIEINVFGDEPLRCAVLFWAYYQGELHVIDWRWCEPVGIKLGFTWDGWVFLKGNLPRTIDGRSYLYWEDQGVSRWVYTNGWSYTRSREDRELAERSRLPAEKRPKLTGGGYSADSVPMAFPSPTPTPTPIVEVIEPMVAP